MAVVAPSSPEIPDPKPDKPEAETSQLAPQDPSPALTPPSSVPEAPNPNPNPAALTAPPPPPPPAPSFTPTFRPIIPAQFTPLANPSIPNPSFQPSMAPPGVVPPHVSQVPPPGVYYSAPGQAPGVQPRPYWQPPQNGYMAPPTHHAPGMVPPPGIPRYPAPYQAMLRPAFPPRPPMPISCIPPISRPPVPGVSGTPTISPVVRPVIPIVAPTEKPQTTVYVGKISSTVQNDFLLSILRLCGPVKSWKRAQDPSDGTPRGFGFCEFESAEGVLRALRLLTKLNIDGQELVLNVNQATREYLERYVEKKKEREKLKELEVDGAGQDNETPDMGKQIPPKADESSEKKTDNSDDKEKVDSIQKFGIVTDEDQTVDNDALEKIKNMLEERLKNKPLLPPPPSVAANPDGPAKSNSELPSKSRDGESDADITRNSENKAEEETTSERKPSSEHDKIEAGSADKSRKRERSRERDRERDIQRDKERELERYERDRERERARRERERDIKMRESERRYKDRVKEWEGRERDKEHQRQYEKEREKERENKRRREIMDQEEESDDDDTRRRRHRSGTLEEKKRRVQRERDDDLADRLREEEEIAEARKRAKEEQKLKEESKPVPALLGNDDDYIMQEDKMNIDGSGSPKCQTNGNDYIISIAPCNNNEKHGNDNTETKATPISVSEVKQNNSTSRKLGFGLTGSGKRTSVPSVFHEEDDEDVEKDKKMRPLVPIDYTTEELQAVQASVSGTPPNLVAAAEFAKRISSNNVKEERYELEKDRHRRSNDRQRERERHDGDSKHTRSDNRDKGHDKSYGQEDKRRTIENKKLFDAKQLIDMIPKTKEELFSYQINWTIYDKHELHERMRPWISKKITEFLGEEEVSFVEYIVDSTKNHVTASEMLELLESVLDEEAEMFVLKMWRMLIFEIKKVETGLAAKSRG